jgi:hypothetical protein
MQAMDWEPGNLDADIQAHGASWQSYLPQETAAYIPKMLGNVAGGASGGGNTVIRHSDGDTTVNTAATDAKGIARDWKKSVVAAARGGPS